MHLLSSCNSSLPTNENNVDTSLEMYLGEDILQGEKVPFYLIWKEIPIERIQITYRGFKSLTRLYNVKGYEKTTDGAVVKKEDFKTAGYLGGVLSTTLGGSPAQHAELILAIERAGGNSVRLKEERILHSARASILNQPSEVNLPAAKGQQRIKVDIQGAASVIIDIAGVKGGLKLVFPPEVLTAVERFIKVVVENMERLKKEYPKYSELLSLLSGDLKLSGDHKEKSFTQLERSLKKRIEKVKDDEDFMEALALVYVTAILEQESAIDTILIPIMEYLESGTSAKAFLNSPFLCAKVPKGGGVLKCRLRFFDLLNHNCAKSLTIKTRLLAYEEMLVPLKEIIQFTRGSGINDS